MKHKEDSLQHNNLVTKTNQQCILVLHEMLIFIYQKT